MNTIARNETSTKEVTKAEIKSITSVEDSSYNDDYVEESNQEAKQRLKSQKIAKASEKKQDANIKDGIKQEESKPNTSAEDESPVFNANKFTQLKLVAEEIHDKLLVKEDWANYAFTIMVGDAEKSIVELRRAINRYKPAHLYSLIALLLGVDDIEINTQTIIISSLVRRCGSATFNTGVDPL